jgi:hypothetical protein
MKLCGSDSCGLLELTSAISLRINKPVLSSAIPNDRDNEWAQEMKPPKCRSWRGLLGCSVRDVLL